MKPAVRYTIPPGTRVTECKGCLAKIAWLLMPSSKRMPVNLDGTPHWATCPSSDEFRSRKKLEERLAELKSGKAGAA